MSAARPSAARPEPYPLLRLGELEPDLRNDDLIRGVLGRGTLGAIYGAPGASKSFVAIELALCVALGVPWRGHRTRQGGVLYIAAEGARGMRNRLLAAARLHEVERRSAVPLALLPSAVRLDAETQDVDRLLSTVMVNDLETSLVIVDTLSQAMPGKDQNGTVDMTAAAAVAGRIGVELGATVLLVHHSGKDASRGLRGNNALEATLDTILHVAQDGDGVCTILSEKQKELPTGRVWRHRLETVELGADEDGEPVTSCYVRPLEPDEVAASLTPSRRRPGRPSSAEDVLAAIADLDAMGKRQRVPRNVLADSGYLDAVAKRGFDPAVEVDGYSRKAVANLLACRFASDGNPAGTSDGNSEELRKKREAERKRVSRRIDSAIREDLVCAHDDWIWLRERDADGYGVPWDGNSGASAVRTERTEKARPL